MSATTDRLLDNLRVRLPGSVDAAIQLELFNVIDELARLQTLPVQPPAPSGALVNWLPAAQWESYYSLLLDGVLARMHSQPARPYSDMNLAVAHKGLYDEAVQRFRTLEAQPSDGATQIAQRLVDNVRQNVPLAYDSVIRSELFNVIDEAARRSLQTTPPVRGASMASWLTEPQWAEYFTMLLDGTLARLLAQLGKPYSEPKLAMMYEAKFREALARVRDDTVSSATTTTVERLMDELRIGLPNSKDGVLQLTLFSVVNELCRDTGCYFATLEVPLAVGQGVYDINPAYAEVLEVIEVSHPTLAAGGAIFERGRIALPNAPTADDLAFALFVEVTLSPYYTGSTSDPATWLPAWMWNRHYQTLLDGVLARMMIQPAKPYSSPVMGRYHLQRFAQGKARATRDGFTQNNPNGQHWRFPFATM